MPLLLLVLLLAAKPALAAHSGVVPPRDGFALSDVAMFVVAAAGVLLARRALRRRWRRRNQPRD